MKRIALVLFLTVPLLADVKQLVDEGVRLYDAGRYDEAVEKLKAALAEDPSSDLAAYELGLTYFAKGDHAQCIALMEPRVKAKKNEYRSAMYSVLGNCQDHAGDANRAIATYRKGLKVDGNDTQLLFNLAVTLTQRGEYDEARKLLKKELELRPSHPGGYHVLGAVFEAQGFRIPAALAFLRVLTLEPAGARAKEAASHALALLGASVEKKDDANITINIDPKPRKEEGDYSAFEMMMAMAAAGEHLPESQGKSEFERKRAALASALAIAVELTDATRRRDFTAKQVIPFFRALYDRKLLDTFAGIAIAPLNLPGMEEWQKNHQAEVEQYMKLMRGEG